MVCADYTGIDGCSRASHPRYSGHRRYHRRSGVGASLEIYMVSSISAINSHIIDGASSPLRESRLLPHHSLCGYQKCLKAAPLVAVSMSAIQGCFGRPPAGMLTEMVLVSNLRGRLAYQKLASAATVAERIPCYGHTLEQITCHGLPSVAGS